MNTCAGVAVPAIGCGSVIIFVACYRALLASCSLMFALRAGRKIIVNEAHVAGGIILTAILGSSSGNRSV